ncbi:CDP-glycerol glycerophosphotransferase family protein [Cytobacillus firmus]|uniref:glycosyltransferase n=1 Tax=Cytobacillus firmus TaxID=1399 RepID=UPI0020425831|nr:glycosyltransferase [Cytobacillus firmus]MCM3705702.1 CDP-glycerol glycerophosphotransferase family protein [Cytobacillus firmus]
MWKVIRKIKTAIGLLIKPFKEMYIDKNFQRSVKFTRLYKKSKIRDNVILYESSYSTAIGDSPYAIFKELVNNSEYSHYKHIWAVDSETNINKGIFKESELKNVEFVRVHSNKYIKGLVSAKYLINNCAFPTYFQKKDEQVYVYTVDEIVGELVIKNGDQSLSEYNNKQRNLFQSDYILMSNKSTAETVVDYYRLEGIYNGKIILEGAPKMDLLINTDCKKVKQYLSSILNINLNKKIVLFSPSISEDKENIEKYIIFINELNQKLSEESYQLLVRDPSGAFNKLIDDNFKHNKIFIPKWVENNELLSVIDILITNSSGIIGDYLVTNKPIIFLGNKEDNEVVEGVLGPFCENSEEVLKTIKEIHLYSGYYSNVRNNFLKTSSISSLDGKITKRNINIIFGLNQTDNYYEIKNTKKNLLFYCGGFLNNGITSSAINLLDNIDYSKYNVVVIEREKFDKVFETNIEKLNNNVKKIFRVGDMNMDFKEYYSHEYITKKGLINPQLHKFIPNKLYQREIDRLFGNIKFDIVVDFSGYVPFWSLLFACGDFKKKYIYQHNDMLAESKKIINNKFKHRSKMNVIFPLYKYFDKVISVSEYIRDENLKNLKEYIPDEKAVFVHNSIDYKKILRQTLDGDIITISTKDYFLVNNSFNFGKLNIEGIMLPSDKNINFISIGRLSPEKDHRKLILAFSKIAKIHSYVRLYIVGEGPLEYELKKLSSDIGLKDQVIFTGQLSNPFYFANKCDCLILSSNHEGQPMTLLEALVIGLPIISTNIPGSKSLLENGYGELVENSETGLINGMDKFIKGKIKSKKFDYISYNQNALQMFYEKVCS